MSADIVVLTAAQGDEDADSDSRVRVEAVVDLVAGGRLRQITVSDGADSVALLAADDEHDPRSTGWGSFPMAPWAGRVRHGRFRFRGDDVRLDLNHADGSGAGGGPIVPPDRAPTDPMGDDDHRHAIHGTTFAHRWDPVEIRPDRIEMTCPLDDALGWPFPGMARQVVSVSGHQLVATLSVEPDVGSCFPAALGWHPWFAKPDRLDFHPLAMYARDAIGLPTGELVTPAMPPWDDCFVNREPVALHYDRRLAAVVTVSSHDCDHWVVYDMPAHATCVEPQSGPPDALTLRPDVATSTHPVRRTMTIAW